MAGIILNDIRRLVQPMKNQLAGMIVRGILSAVKDAEGIQMIKISALKNEERDDIERPQQYGFTSHPLKGAELLFLSPNGDRSSMICICADDPRYRPEIQPGESALYSDQGLMVLMREDGKIAFGTRDADDPLVRKSDLQAHIDAFNGHTHNATTTATLGLAGAATVTVVPPSAAPAATGSPVVMGDSD
jgi:phage baseplate assembly protein V